MGKKNPPTPIDIAVGQELACRCKQRGWTQRQFAELCDLTPAAVSMRFLGQRMKMDRTIEAMCYVLGCKISEMIAGAENRLPPTDAISQ